MMSWGFTFVAIIAGMLFFAAIVALVLVYKAKKFAKDVGLKKEDVSQIIGSINDVESTPKTISGMTNLMLPKIVADFPEFDKDLIFRKTEESLSIIFNSLSTGSKDELDKIPLLKGIISNAIDDYENNNIKVNFSDIKFHKFTIRYYTKENGVATITVDTALEYYYTKEKDGKKIVDCKRKMQTAYSCNFIYIYDESAIDETYYRTVVGLNCPNCGAPIRSLKQESCSYCGTAIAKIYKDINVKGWAFSSYKEY